MKRKQYLNEEFFIYLKPDAEILLQQIIKSGVDPDLAYELLHSVMVEDEIYDLSNDEEKDNDPTEQ